MRLLNTILLPLAILSLIDTVAADTFTASAKPQLIAPGSISGELGEYSPTWDVGRQQLIFMRRTPGEFDYTLYQSSYRNGEFSEPAVLPFSGKYRDAGPSLSPDGQRLVFDSRRPDDRVAERSINIWITERIGDDWSEPRLVKGASLNASAEPVAGRDEFGPVLDAKGQLYFYSFRKPYRGGEHFLAVGPGFDDAVPASEFPDPSRRTFVSYFSLSSDTNTLVMEGASEPGGDTDLYYACREDSGWTDAVALGSVNSESGDGGPYLSSDGKTLFFVSDRSTDDPSAGDANIYAVSTDGLPIPCR